MSATIELAKALMQCESVTPDDAGCQTIIRSYLEPLGFKCESLRFDEVDNLWARYGTQAPLLVFAGHTDVVPTGPVADWTFPPFTPTEHKGYLYGRGATDMKGAVAASVIAAIAFIKAHPDFPGSIGFLITSDEEGPSINGTKKVMETLTQRKEKIDYCLIGEPASDKQLGDQIRVGRRGSLHGKLIIHGKQGHVAHPHLAENPIHLSLQALQELVQTEWDKGNEQFPPTTFQISNIHAGTGAANVIPGQLEVVFNFRFSTASTIEQLKTYTESIFKKYHLTYDMNWIIGAEPFLTRKGDLVEATVQAIKQVTQLSPTFSTGGGTSDGRFIAPTGAEVVELGVCNTTAHHIDEHVSIKDLDILTNCYQAILEHIFKD